MEIILFFMVSAIMVSADKFKNIPERSLNVPQKISALLPTHLHKIQVEPTNIFGKNFGTGTFMECAESIKMARSNMIETIKNLLYNDLESSLKNYSVCMYAVLDEMINRKEPINEILNTITMSNSKGYIILQFLFNNDIDINDILTKYILFSDLDYMFNEYYPGNNNIGTLRQSIDYITKLQPNIVTLSDKKFKLKLKELSLIKEQIDSLSLGIQQINNNNEKWMTADILKWKRLLSSKTIISKMIGNEISEKNGKSLFEWFQEIKKTADAREISLFYIEVGNILVNYVGKKITLKKIFINNTLKTLMKTLTKIENDYTFDLEQAKSDQKNVEVYPEELICERNDLIDDVKTNYENTRYELSMVLLKFQDKIDRFINLINHFIHTMYGKRRFSCAKSLTPLLSDLKQVRSQMDFNRDLITANKFLAILVKLNISPDETNEENSTAEFYIQNYSTVLKTMEVDAELIANINEFI